MERGGLCDGYICGRPACISRRKDSKGVTYDFRYIDAENYGKENTDYTEVISVLEKALENQKNYLNTAVENENVFFKNITEKMNGI